MKFGLFKGIAIAGLAMTMLSSCSGGNCTPNESLSLSLTAPNQYPAGIASTAYLTITNTSGVVANNLYYTIPAETNTTGVDNITVQNGVDKQPCINIAAHDSCTFPVDIAAGSVPGSFKVVATPDGQPTVSNKVKSLFSLKAANSLELTANIGLTELQSNEQIGANGITFLYSKILPANANGSTPVDIVAVVNSQFASSCVLAHGLNRPEPQCPFNTINLTDQAGNLLDFRVLSANSGTGYSDLAQNAIVTFRLTIPQGTTNLSFYAQTMKNGTLVKQGDIANPIRLTTSPEGIVEVLPTYFKLSAVDNYTTQTVTYTNTGNAEVTNLKIQEPQSPIVISENNCPANLAVGSSCNVKVTSHAESGVAGTGSLVASYNGGIGSTDVISQYDYKGLNPIAGISLSATNNFAFAANTVFSSESTQVTLTNTGNVNESSFTFTFNPNYFTLATGSGLNPCNISSDTVTTTLGAGQSCTFTLTYTNATVESGTSDITIAYKYQDYYGVSRDMSGNKSASYVTTQATASLNVAPNPKSFGTIIVNSSDFKVETFTLTNNGVDTAESVSIGNSGVFSVQNSTCSQTLAPSASCTFDVKFGPTATESSSLTESLPITYKSVTDSSHLPVLLNLVVDGVARAPLSASIEISSVSYPDSVGGDGEGSATPFQIESKDATSAIMTLTYKNVGSYTASNFSISTQNNMPAGYTLLANSCGSPAPINLAPNNTCDVTLKLATASTGSNNISFSTTVLPASWTDERGPQTNKAVSWNTGTSTLNTVYVNVFATPYITVTSSATSVAPSESVIFTFNLYGGYNVQAQTLTTENPNSTDITLEDSPCSVSSSSASCTTKAIFAASITPESYTFTFNNNGGDVPLSPESLVVSVAEPVGNFMAVGAGGAIYKSSNNGRTWTEVPKGDGYDADTFRGVTVNSSGKFVAVGYGGVIVTSTDGINFTLASGASSTLYSVVANSSNEFVAVGNATSQPNQAIVTSTNGDTWTPVNSGDASSLKSVTVSSAGKFVAVGASYRILTSNDAITWDETTLEVKVGSVFNGVTVNDNGKFVTVGSGGKILTSSNGSTWTAVTSGTTEELNGVTVNSSGKFVAVGGNGVILTSDDGDTWAVATSGTTAILRGVAVNSNGKFVVVGDNGVVLTSSDGSTWVSQTPAGSNTLYSVTAY